MSFSKPFGAKSAALGVEARGREWSGWGSQQRAVQNSRPGGTWLPGDGRTGIFPEAAFVLQAPHLTWGYLGLLLEVTGIQASDELSLRPPLVYRGQNPGVWLSCSQSVPGVLPGVPAGGGKEERGERAWERSKTLELGGGVIGILGTEAPQRPGSTRGPPPGTRLHIHLPQPWPRGPQAPSNACVCTLVCMSSTVHSQCHWSPDHVCRAPDLLCLTPESAV